VAIDYFDERIAASYDASVAEEFTPETIQATARFLAARAGGGRALELGIGTGRIALPLRALGVEVHGIDLSEAMVARLHAKDGGADVPVAIGDFSATRVEGAFSLVYLVFNTIMNLTTQDLQVACFANAARHLEPGGCFVVEVMVPALQRLHPGETLVSYGIGPDHVDLDEYDVVGQGLVSHHYRVVDGQLLRNSVPFRYAWPAELDLMARLAGLELRERLGGWSGEPFDAASEGHVSVWARPRG
jgi:SAM-dependent methyltransferase